MIRYEQLQSHEASRLRAVRLRALQDAPDAFGATFAETSARTEGDWGKQIAELPTFVAVEDGRDLAMVRCKRDQHRADTAWLLSMWVTPEARRASSSRNCQLSSPSRMAVTWQWYAADATSMEPL